MGDYWNVATSAIDIRAYLSEGQMNSVANARQAFLPFGTGSNRDGYCLRSENHESPAGEWTTLELICYGDQSLHLVNGHVVMVLQKSRYLQDGKESAADEGTNPVAERSGRSVLQGHSNQEPAENAGSVRGAFRGPVKKLFKALGERCAYRNAS
jgi:hypothetical protein